MSSVRKSKVASKCQVPRLQSTPVLDPSLEVAASRDSHSSATGLDDWVQCSKCEKWRLICARDVKAENLPENWECRAMTWLPGLSSCRISEKTTTAAAYKLLGVPMDKIDFEILSLKASCSDHVSKPPAVPVEINPDSHPMALPKRICPVDRHSEKAYLSNSIRSGARKGEAKKIPGKAYFSSSIRSGARKGEAKKIRKETTAHSGSIGESIPRKRRSYPEYARDVECKFRRKQQALETGTRENVKCRTADHSNGRNLSEHGRSSIGSLRVTFHCGMKTNFQAGAAENAKSKREHSALKDQRKYSGLPETKQEVNRRKRTLGDGDFAVPTKDPQRRPEDGDHEDRRKKRKPEDVDVDVDVPTKRKRPDHVEIEGMKRRSEDQHLDVDVEDRRKKRRPADVNVDVPTKKKRPGDVEIERTKRRAEDVDVRMKERKQRQEDVEVATMDRREVFPPGHEDVDQVPTKDRKPEVPRKERKPQDIVLPTKDNTPNDVKESRQEVVEVGVKKPEQPATESNVEMNNSMRREEAVFWVMNARMEAAALIKAAADLRRRIPNMEDERPIADLYLQAGMKYLQTARHQEVICTGSHGQGSGDMSYLQNYVDGAEILDHCTEKYEKIPDYGKTALCHIIAGFARMRLLSMMIRSSYVESTKLLTTANLYKWTEYQKREIQTLRLDGCSVASFVQPPGTTGTSSRQNHSHMCIEEISLEPSPETSIPILPTAIHSFKRFLKNSANISPMLDSWIKARDCLASAEAAGGDSKHEKAMLEVRKVCSMAMFDDFEKLFNQVYVALDALN